MYFNKKLCLFGLEVQNQMELFEAMSSTLQEANCVDERYFTGICEREAEYPTALFVENQGFAIPHTDSSMVIESQICFASLKSAIPFQDMTNKDHTIMVDLVFMIAMKHPHEQVETLQNLVGLFQDKQAINALKACRNQETFIELLRNANIT